MTRYPTSAHMACHLTPDPADRLDCETRHPYCILGTGGIFSAYNLGVGRIVEACKHLCWWSNDGIYYRFSIWLGRRAGVFPCSPRM